MQYRTYCPQGMAATRVTLRPGPIHSHLLSARICIWRKGLRQRFSCHFFCNRLFSCSVHQIPDSGVFERFILPGPYSCTTDDIEFFVPLSEHGCTSLPLKNSVESFDVVGRFPCGTFEASGNGSTKREELSPPFRPDVAPGYFFRPYKS